MLGGAAVELINGEGFLALDEPECGFCHDQVKIAGLVADRAVAVLDGDLGGRRDFEPDGAAVAAAAVGYIPSRWTIQKSEAPPQPKVASRAMRP